jgi:uncharacterized protein HemX
MTTTEQTSQLGANASYNGGGDVVSRTRAVEAVSEAGTKAASTVKKNPKSSAAALLAVAGAAVAAVIFGRKRAAAKAAPRNRFAAIAGKAKSFTTDKAKSITKR